MVLGHSEIRYIEPAVIGCRKYIAYLIECDGIRRHTFFPEHRYPAVMFNPVVAYAVLAGKPHRAKTIMRGYKITPELFRHSDVRNKSAGITVMPYYSILSDKSHHTVIPLSQTGCIACRAIEKDVV